MTKPSGRKVWFRSLAIAVACAAALIFAELAARYRDASIRRSDRMEPGLTRYDARLGWILSAGWEGRHQHHDFDVRYRVGSGGYRSDPAAGGGSREGRIAVVGDSFTFGLGVNDDETFVHRLNEKSAGHSPFWNCAVPGYSTDQQLILIEREVLVQRPAALVIVVYLANDLLDNQYAFPLQAGGGKPFFELSGDGLRLLNSPVGQERKSGADAQRTLAVAVFGRENLPAGGGGVSRLGSMLLDRWKREPDHGPLLRERLAPSVDLFEAIARRIVALCAEAQVAVEFVLLAGRSHLEEPGSASAQYQEYYRLAAGERLRRLGIAVTDVADGLRMRRAALAGAAGGRWFYPHDGHLTPAGHRVVAEILWGELQCVKPPPKH